MFDLSSTLPTDHDVSVVPGTSILVTGPPMVGKGRIVHELLADGFRQGEGALVVTTEDRAETVRDRFATIEGFDKSRLGVVDCRSAESASAAEDTPLVKYVGSPGDLTGIGIGVTECMNVLDAVGTGRNRLALSSLSTLLSYTDRETVFKFCHVLTARAESQGYLGVYSLDASAHDPRTVNMLQRAFDVGIEVRETDDGQRELRVIGLTQGNTDWRAI